MKAKSWTPGLVIASVSMALSSTVFASLQTADASLPQESSPAPVQATAYAKKSAPPVRKLSPYQTCMEKCKKNLGGNFDYCNQAAQCGDVK